MSRPTPPVAMTIAGTDSGSGAGVGADVKAFAAHGVHGVFVVTVVTAQNTVAVRSAHPIPAEMIAAQIDALVDDFSVLASKTGLLWGVEAIAAVSDRVDRLGSLVVDPVLVNSRRERMQPPEVDQLYRTRLFPAALVVTPNVAEAELLTGMTIETTSDAEAAAERLLEDGPSNVVITGLLSGGDALDVWAGPHGVTTLLEPLVEMRNVHGTGCSFAATIAARLAHGDSAAAAIPEAKRTVAAGIRAAAEWELGDGQGPIDHFWRNDV